MSLFDRLGKKGKNEKLPVPDGFTAEDIRVEASVCTGERTVGFYSRADKRLHCSELVRTDADIDAFYARYGLSRPTDTKQQ